MASALILAIIQGATEFLPISSSAHLILLPRLAGWEDQGVLIDVAVHFGAAPAVCLYFRRDLSAMGRAVWRWRRFVRHRDDDADRLAFALILASLPLFPAAALVYASGLASFLRSEIHVIAWANLVFAAALWLSDRLGGFDLDERRMDRRHALAIGCAQILALIPGASRSGVAMTAGRALGLDRERSARFAMLLSVPILLAFGCAGLIEATRIEGRLPPAALTAAALSFAAAAIAIRAFMAWVRRATLTIFVVYRLGLGAVLLWLF